MSMDIVERTHPRNDLREVEPDPTPTVAPPAWFQRECLERDPEAFLAAVEHFRHAGDPQADAFFAELRARRIALKDAYPALLEQADDEGSAASALLGQMRSVPEWVDFALMRRGGAMAQRNFPMMILALSYGALPLVFVHPDSAAVFGGTGHFAASVPRRLQESALLFFGVTDTDALRPDARMWQVCLRVRLIHAAVRHHLRRRPDWDARLRGVPISALQTATGPAFFGTRLLAGMAGLGAVVEEDEALGHRMAWRYVTYLLGVPPQLLGQTQEDQDAFDEAVLPFAFAPDDRSRALVAEVIAGLRSAPQTRGIPPTMQVAMMRRMLGESWADALAIPASSEDRLRSLVRVLRAYSRAASLPGIALVTQFAGRLALRSLMGTPLVEPRGS
ncbi:MAG: oxygenase MpaB family protein [Myxococcales bacterium]